MDAIIFLTPRPNIIEHEHMVEKVLLASMALTLLIKPWSLSSSQTDEFPQEKHHKDIQG
jgi:hypothetical protein